MPLRIIEISAPDEASEKIQELADRYEAIDYWYNARNKDGRRTTRILVDVNNQQELLDALQRSVARQKDWRIALIPVEATLPKPESEADRQKNGNAPAKAKKIVRGSITREELYHEIEQGANITFDFLLLVILSTIVAGIGLIESNIAVVIGAMVIAPLLGPNLALAFGAALGDRDMIFRAARTNAAGILLTLMIAIIGGQFMSSETLKDSTELMARTDVNFAGLVLALASGAAAVLSMTTGLSSALVGVMVAVALMPPAVALGLLLGAGQWGDAYGALLLLAANIVCVNLSALGIFRLKGIRPRTWFEEQQSRQSIKTNVVIWASLLLALAILIWVKGYFFGQP